MDEQEQQEDAWARHSAAQAAWWEKRAAGQQEEKLRQNNMMYGGLIAIGVVLVQPFLTVDADTLDWSAKICVIAFSLTIPLLAALMVLNSQEVYRRRMTASAFVLVVGQGALGLGFVGVVAGFWHIMTLAGVAVLVAGILGLTVYSVGFSRVEVDDAHASGDPGPPPAP